MSGGTMAKKERLAVAWCDNGIVDGKFMEGVVDTLNVRLIHGSLTIQPK